MPFSKPSENMFLTNVEDAVYYYGTWAWFLLKADPNIGNNARQNAKGGDNFLREIFLTLDSNVLGGGKK